MPSYLITGVSRGLGWEFLRQLSEDQDNIVVGIVRNKASTDKRVAEELRERSNITIVEADLTNFNSIRESVAATAKVTGGSLDYLIANAAPLSGYDNYDPIGVLFQNPELFTEELTKALHGHITCQLYLINSYIPLLLKGSLKKVIFITSGHADMEVTRKFDIDTFAIYAISKSGMHTAMAKLSAEYRKDGILFLSLSPGVADVGHHRDLTPAQMESQKQLLQKFLAYAPHFRGPSTPEDAVKAVISVWEKASIENGNGGAFLSHRGEHGNWL